jgi:hypothetical protein
MAVIFQTVKNVYVSVDSEATSLQPFMYAYFLRSDVIICMKTEMNDSQQSNVSVGRSSFCG